MFQGWDKNEFLSEGLIHLFLITTETKTMPAVYSQLSVCSSQPLRLCCEGKCEEWEKAPTWEMLMWVGLGLRVGGEMGQPGLVNRLVFSLELAE